MSEPPENKDLPPLFLKDLIRQVRAELLDIVAENERTGTHGIFVVEGVSLEVNVTIDRKETIDGKMGANLVVVELSSKAAKSTRTEHVHKVTLQLGARQPRSLTENSGGGGAVLASGKIYVEDIPEEDWGGKLILDTPAGIGKKRKINSGLHPGLIKINPLSPKGDELR